MRLVVCILFLFLATGCSNTPIDDGAQFGPFTQVKTLFTSAFLAETDEGVVLVDAGFSASAKQIGKALEERSLALSDVSDVIITHGHSDHVIGLEAFPSARVWAHEDEVARIEEEAAEGVEVTHTVVDGDTIAVGALAMEVLHVPGHTEGNLCVLSEGVLLMGDTAMSFKDGTVGPAPERYSEDPEAAAQALLALRDRLLDREETLEAVVFAHSGGLNDPAAFWNMAGN